MANRTNRYTPPTTRPDAPRATTTAEADRSALSSKTLRRPTPSEEDVRARAYFLWEKAGRPASDGVQFWLEAERELNSSR